MMTQQPDILCIGSVLWDLIGRAPSHMRVGSDVPGRITRLPGGVAMNIAMTLRRFGMVPALLTNVGRDTEGDALIAAANGMGMVCDHVYRSEDLPTDVYMAIEGANGLIAAIADAHSLEAAGDKILRPMASGALGSMDAPWNGPVALDGNLTAELLREIATSPLFRKADLRVAPASPGKAERLRPLLGHPRATLYVYCEEAGLITGTTPTTAEDGAAALIAAGARRVLVTDGAAAAVDADAQAMLSCHPPAVKARRITGAGDTFMAAHIAAEARGLPRKDALDQALAAAAQYVAGDHHG
jgi:sugar/nucleoside kinase (ribokinase family)